MTSFSIITAVMILIALALLAPALLRKRELATSDRDEQNVIIAREHLQEMETDLQAGLISQEEFDQARVELEQALLLDLKQEDVPEKMATGSGRLTLGVIAVAIPLLAVSMYMSLGAPEMLGFDAAKQASSTPAGQGKLPSIEEMLAGLKQHLQEKPEDPEGWYLLARTYMTMQDYPKAIEAYETLLRLTGENPSIMLALAEAMIWSQQGDMQGRPAELIRRSLEIEPENQVSLWMNGLLESQSGNYPKALEHLKRLEAMAQEQPEALERVRSMIAAVEEKAASSATDKK